MQQQPQAKVLPNNWIEYYTPENQPYYHNTVTKETTWTHPFENPNAGPLPPNQIPFQPNLNPNAMPMMNPGMNVFPGPGMGYIGHQQQMERRERSPPVMEKPKEKEKAVSMKQIEGTEWKLVTTNHNNHYYYHSKTKTTSWTIPEEIKDVVEELEKKKEEAEKEKIIQAAEQAKRKLEDEDEDSEEEEGSKKFKQDEDEEEEEEEEKEKEEEELKPAELNLPQEEKIKIFMELLKDMKVSAFSTWEKEVSKLMDDPRFNVLSTLRERKNVFDQYCKKRVQEEAIERKQQLQKSKEDFQELLKQASKNFLTYKTSYEDFLRHFRDDPRIKIIQPKEREALFKDMQKTLRDQEVERRRGSGDTSKQDFLNLLKETKEINSNSTYDRSRKYIEKDKRFDAIRSSRTREELFTQYVKSISEEAIKKEKERRAEESLRERERVVQKEREKREKEVRSERSQYQKEDSTMVFQSMLVDFVKTHEITWQDIKKVFQNDSRNERCHLNDREKEELFDKHIATLYEKRKKSFFSLLDEITKGEVNMTWDIILEKEKDKLEDFRYLRLTQSDDSREEQAKMLYVEYLKEREQILKKEFQELLDETKFLQFYMSSEVVRAGKGTAGEDLKEEEENSGLQLSHGIEKPKEDLDSIINLQQIHAVLSSDSRFQKMGSNPELKSERDKMIQRYIETKMESAHQDLRQRTSILQGTLPDH